MMSDRKNSFEGIESAANPDIKISGWRPRTPAEIERDIGKADANLQLETEELKRREQTLLASGVPDQTAIKEVRESIERLTRPPGLMASGGTSFTERMRIARWPSVPEETLWDTYGLTGSEISFGVGELETRKFVILRQRQNIANRGGYAYTVLFDPGELVWRLAQWNGAAIIKTILQNAEVKDKFLVNPQQLAPSDLGVIIEHLKHQELTVPPKINTQLRTLFEEASQATKVRTIGKASMENRPSPEDFAEALAAVPEEVRKKITWLLGGGLAHGRSFGSKVVWDPDE